MKYSDLLESGASATEIQTYLRDSELVSVTIRIPRTLRDSAKEAASLSGMNFTSFVKSCMIERLAKSNK
jgi:predicted DNA binding CopG/RHH family protein